jgi:hypothetical protein
MGKDLLQGKPYPRDLATSEICPPLTPLPSLTRLALRWPPGQQDDRHGDYCLDLLQSGESSE